MSGLGPVSDWDLEVRDMAIHWGIAAALTYLGANFLPWWALVIWILLIVAVFWWREFSQQKKKAHPPSPSWAFWLWGPRGQWEWYIATIGVLCGLALAAIIPFM